MHEIQKAYEENPFFDENNVLNFSIIVTYPEFQQMDFIQKARETDLLKDHLLEILKNPLPWDEKKYYSYDNCVAFVELNCVTPLYRFDKHTNYQDGYKRVNRNRPLSETLTLNGYVLPFLLEIFVVSKVSPFIDKFMTEFEIIMKS